MSDDNKIIRVGDQEFLAVPITATLQLLDKELMEHAPAEVLTRNKAVAKQLYWQTEDNPDLVWVQFILDTEGTNGNWDYNPRSNIIANHATAKYKPMDMNHVIKEEKSLVYADLKNPPTKNTIFGVMTNTAIANADGEILSEKELVKLPKDDDPFRPAKDRISIVAWAALYGFLFPQTVGQLLEAIKAGSMKVSMERWIRKWDFLVTDGVEEVEVISRAKAEENGVFENWKIRRPILGKQTWRRSISAIYGGVASTSNPANVASRFLEQSVVKAAASQAITSPIFEKLLSRHSELHQLFGVSPEEQSCEIITEHEQVTSAIAAFMKAEGSVDPDNHDVLDMTLPSTLKGIVNYQGVVEPAIVDSTEVVSSHANSEDSLMTTPATAPASQPATIDTVAIATAAKEAAQAFLKESHDQAALAETFTRLTTEKMRAQAELTAATATITELTTKLTTAEAAFKAFEKKGKEDKEAKDKDDDEKDKNFKKAKADLEAAQAEILKFKEANQKEASSKKASTRTNELKPYTKGAKSKAMLDKAIAMNADGTLAMSDEAFTDLLDTAKMGFEAAGGKLEETPAAAPAAGAPAAPAAAAPAAAPANAPLPPDLTGAAAMATAQATMLAAQNLQPTATGRTTMANAFSAV